MEKVIATAVFESLSSAIGLDVYGLLVCKGTEGMVAGEIAPALDIPPTKLPFHLKALTHARLATGPKSART